MKDKAAETIQNAIQTLIFDKHGPPRRILTNCGSEFLAKNVQEVFNKNGIKPETGSPYHHETTGAVERVNATLMDKVWKLAAFSRKQWPKYIEQATQAVKISFHRAIGLHLTFLDTVKYLNTELMKN